MLRAKEKPTDNNQSNLYKSEDLIELLNNHKRILPKEMIDYLNSLINLELSVLKPNISNEEREILTELEIYRQIAIYNIYKRALMIMKKENNQFNISISDDHFLKSNYYLMGYVSINDKTSSIFKFNYKLNSNSSENNNIGDINLFLTIDNPELREQEMLNALAAYVCEGNKRNPHPRTRKIGGPGSQWSFEHQQKLAELEKKFNTLDNRKELDDDTKRIIDIKQLYYEKFLEEYGLTQNDFEEETKLSKLTILQRCIEPDKMHKTLIKKYPGISVKTNITNL